LAYWRVELRLRDEPTTPAHHHIFREVVIHTVAFCAAVAIGAIVLSRYYGIFQHDTDNASEASEAFLAAVAIVGAAGPLITALFFWLHAIMRRPGAR
jgi:hypothetical protein